MQTLTFAEMADRYCARQVQTPEGLRKVLQDQKQRFNNEGWMLLECQMMDSSSLGSLVIMPYGPSNTYKEPITTPVSPRGLASDMSICVAVMLADQLR